MCGIFAACDFHHPVSLDLAGRAIRRLHHRGPDGSGFWLSPFGQVVLAHARLSLVGVSNGTQPLASENRRIQAIVNGEFYGFREIRRTLESRGHRFDTESDSEILVHLYEHFGIRCIEHLRGEFAFVLWDQDRQTLFAARDRFGIKPLVYAVSNNRILLASEARAILPEIEARWNHESMFFASAFQYLPPGHTLFEGIKQLPPGHVLTFDATGHRTSCYWDFDYPESLEPNDADAVDEKSIVRRSEQLREQVRESVQLRMHGEAPVCFHLSGGLDSSSILGLASQLAGEPQHAFTLEFDDAGYDESQLARDTASFCNAVWHPVRVSRRDILEVMTDAVIGSEGLAINGHLSAKYLLNRAIHDCGFRAVLSGEGADEVFGGYAHLRLDHWRSQKSQPATDLAGSNASQVGMMLPSGEGLSTAAAEEYFGYRPVFLEAKATLGKRLRSLMTPDCLQRWESRDPCSELLEVSCITSQLSRRCALRKSTWLWSKLALAGYIFRTLGDGTEMPWSVEGRVPFADHVLFESVREYPPNCLIRGNTEKYILREAMRPFVTESVYARQKHPLDAPPVLMGDLTLLPLVYDRINSAEFRRQPFFCEQRVKSLLGQISQMSLEDRKVWDPVLMMILSTAAIQQLLDSTSGSKS